MKTTQPLPRLPGVLSRPLGLLPPAAWHTGLARLLNDLFATPLATGELDFLARRRVRIRLSDAPVSFTLTLERGRLRVAGDDRPADLEIGGTVYAFMLLASRREDADTLFFRRQLTLQGEAGLGLEVKNFLDALDLGAVPRYGLIEAALRRGLWLADRIDRLQHGRTAPAEQGARNL